MPWTMHDPSDGEPDMEKSRIVDLFMADKVLAGEPVRLLPFLSEGYWRWGTMQPPIDQDVAEELVANWDRRGEAGFHTTMVPLNVEHVDTEGKIGNIANLQVGDDGLYATFDLTDKGQQRLADGEFDYLSPEIVWETKDVRTGDSVGAFLVGAAVTNYPFFGDDTAMFSREAGEHLEAHPPLTGEDLEKGGALSFTQLGDLIGSLFRAALNGGREVETREETTMSDQQQQDGGMQIPEEFRTQLSDMQAQIDQFSADLADRDQTIQAQAETMTAQEGRITELTSSRQRERFSRQVESFSHLGAENEGLVDELMWLHDADQSEKREHFAYWSNLLATMEGALADSAAFQDIGTPAGRTSGNGTAASKFNALIEQRAQDEDLVVSEGDENWVRIAEEIVAANPELYNQYLDQVRHRGR